MVQNRKLLIEITILTLIGIWFFFISTNVNPVLGTIYSSLPILAIGIILADLFFGKKSIKLINKNITWGQSALIAAVGFGAILASSYVASSLAEIIPLRELLGSLAASAPVFSQSSIINFLTFGDIIAYIESAVLFVYLLDLLCSVFDVEINKRNLWNPKAWLIMIGIAFIFLLLHVTAKGIEAEATLIIVFFMAIISCVISFIYLDGRTTILVHVIANTISASTIFLVIYSSSIISQIFAAII